MTQQYIKPDQFGRDRYVAPEGTVLKAYMVDELGGMEHALVDEFGLVFTSGRSGGLGGWSSSQWSQFFRLIVFPRPIPCSNTVYGWDFDEYYERNWLCDSWAWMYMKSADWRIVREEREAA